MSVQRKLTRRGFIGLTVAAAAGTALLAACQPPQTVEKVVEKQVEVTRVVEKPVEVTKIVEKPVEKQVEVTKIVVATPAPQPKGPAQVIFDISWIAETGARPEIIQAATDLFHKNNKTRIILRGESRCQVPAIQKVIATDTIGDAIHGCPHTFVYWAEQGNLFLDITEQLKARNYDWSDHIPHDWAYVYKGKNLGLPFQVSVFDWVANKTLIENAGLKMPDPMTWTWDGILEVGQKFTNPAKNLFAHALYWGIGDHPTWMTAIHSFGGTMISDDGTKTLFDQGPAFDALQMVYDWMYKYKIMPTPKYAQDNKLSTAANFAFSWGTVRTPAAGKPPAAELVQMMPPFSAKTNLRFSQMNCEPHYVTQWATKRGVPDEALDVITFFAGKEVNQMFVEKGGSFPNRISAFDNDAFMPKAARDVVKESNKVRISLEFERTKYWYAWWAAIVPPLAKAFDTNETSLKEAVAQAKAAGDKALITNAYT